MGIRKKKILWACLVLILVSGTFHARADDHPLVLPEGETGLCAAQPVSAPMYEGARLSERFFGLPGLSNVGRLAPGVFRGAQPESAGYETLKRMGIKTVINLRSQHSEKGAVESAGMQSIELPISMLEHMKPETVKAVIALMTEPANQPVYVHCKLGQDRTGVIMAIYRMEVEGWSLEDAEAEMQSFGFNDVWFYFKNYVRQQRKNHSPEMKKDQRSTQAQ